MGFSLSRAFKEYATLGAAGTSDKSPDAPDQGKWAGGSSNPPDVNGIQRTGNTENPDQVWPAEYERNFSGYDDQGFPVDAAGNRIDFAPPAGIAARIQQGAEGSVADRNARFRQDGRDSLMGAQGLLESYRPGGGASLQSGIYAQQAQMLYNDQVQAPDLMFDYRRNEAFNERSAQRKANDTALGIQAGLAALTAITGGVGGLAAGAAAGAGGAALASQAGGGGGGGAGPAEGPASTPAGANVQLDADGNYAQPIGPSPAAGGGFNPAQGGGQPGVPGGGGGGGPAIPGGGGVSGYGPQPLAIPGGGGGGGAGGGVRAPGGGASPAGGGGGGASGGGMAPGAGAGGGAEAAPGGGAGAGDGAGAGAPVAPGAAEFAQTHPILPGPAGAAGGLQGRAYSMAMEAIGNFQRMEVKPFVQMASDTFDAIGQAHTNAIMAEQAIGREPQIVDPRGLSRDMLDNYSGGRNSGWIGERARNTRDGSFFGQNPYSRDGYKLTDDEIKLFNAIRGRRMIQGVSQ